MHAGYQKAIWELREGHLRYCPSQQRLWRRDPDIEDHPGERRLLNSWHPVKSIEDEYHIGERSNDRNRNYAVSSTIMREAKRAQWFRQVERGVRIDRACGIARMGMCLYSGRHRYGCDPDVRSAEHGNQVWSKPNESANG